MGSCRWSHAYLHRHSSRRGIHLRLQWMSLNMLVEDQHAGMERNVKLHTKFAAARHARGSFVSQPHSSHSAPNQDKRCVASVLLLTGLLSPAIRSCKAVYSCTSSAALTRASDSSIVTACIVRRKINSLSHFNVSAMPPPQRALQPIPCSYK